MEKSIHLYHLHRGKFLFPSVETYITFPPNLLCQPGSGVLGAAAKPPAWDRWSLSLSPLWVAWEPLELTVPVDVLGGLAS